MFKKVFLQFFFSLFCIENHYIEMLYKGGFFVLVFLSKYHNSKQEQKGYIIFLLF